MNDTTNLEKIAEEEIDAILPDGWTEDADFFNTKSWSDGESDPDEDDFFADDEDDEPAESGEEEPESPTTGTESGEPETAQQETAEEEPAAPTTEPAPAEAEPAKPTKLRFKARVDHEDVDAEIDESELPTLYQKAAATDRYQKKLAETTPRMERLEAMAKRNGYETIDAMLDAQDSYDREQLVQKLMDEGAAKTLAEDYADRKFSKAKNTAEAPAEQFAPESEPATPSKSVQDSPREAARDLAAEVQELWSMRPELKGTKIPEEVAAAAAEGQNLVMAYLNYENKQARAAAETLRKENEIYKQNAAAAAKAPVRGVSHGGATNTDPEDPFLRGFNSDW